MWNFQDTFETTKQSFSSASSICMNVPLMRLDTQVVMATKILWDSVRINAVHKCFS